MKKITDEYHYIPIVDAGVALDTPAYEEGHKYDVFIKDLRGKEFVGNVWPGDTVFVDYFHPMGNSVWKNWLDGLKSQLNYSGIWLDMN